jgi:hypothetical protein
MSGGNCVSRLAALAILPAVIASADAAIDNEVAVSIRYLQITGISHAHIFLYAWNGKLLKQLTTDDSGQHVNPVFSPKGGEVIFTRLLKTGNELWAVTTDTGKLRKLDAPPPWYAEAADSATPFVLLNLQWEQYYNEQMQQSVDSSPRPTPVQTPRPSKIVTIDGSLEIRLDRSGDDTRDYDNEQLGRLYRVRDLKTGEESVLGTWQNFETMWNPLHLRGHDEQYFLIDPPLRTVFFHRHLNSSDGDTCYALDFNRKRVVRLSPNWATPFSIPSESSFFAWAQVRYMPLGDGKRTVNCSYLDRWNEKFEKVRFGRDAPAICYGASLWRPEKPPVTIKADIP